MTNPLANSDQFDVERAVAAMRDLEAVKRARAAVAGMFQVASGRDTPEEARATFDQAMDEYVNNYLYKAAACDPTRPRIVRAFMPAYGWDGREVPGTRMAGDNPDTTYRMAGIEHGGSYRLTVRPVGTEPIQASFTLNGNFGSTAILGNLESAELERAADGSFVITIDGEPANGRRNHLTTAPTAKFLFIRERFEDWAKETAYDMTIERLDPVAPLDRPIEELAEIAAFRAQEDVPLNFWMQRLFTGLPMNELRKPAGSGGMGGIATMASALGWYRLEPDDAVVIRYQPAGAGYASAQLSDWWFRSIDADRIQSSISRTQAVKNGDGSITMVIARRDPGVANWLDTGGLSTVLFCCRWQGMPAEPVAGGLSIDAEVMTIDALPADLLRNQAIDPDQRAAQIAARQAAWARRTTEG